MNTHAVRLAIVAAVVVAVDRHGVAQAPPRAAAKPLRDVTLAEAVAAPADTLAVARLTTQTLLDLCLLAAHGATINGSLDGQPLVITPDNAAVVEDRLRSRMTVYGKAIEKRGHATLASGYVSENAGACADWGLDDQRVLAEQTGSDVFLTQGATRHRAVIVESAIALRHDANTDVVIVGRITDSGIVFTTPRRGGITGMAEQRCTWTLTPAEVQGSDWAMAFVGRAVAHRSYGDYAAMLADFDRSLALHPEAEVAGAKAYVLATCADERVRDGKAAVEAAELARSLATGEPDVGISIALAVAYAEAGDFVTAIAHQKQVIEMVPDDGKPEQREHLRLFKTGKPFHEERPF